MSNLIRWEPARDMMTLREAMDRLFDDAFTRPLSLAMAGLCLRWICIRQTMKLS